MDKKTVDALQVALAGEHAALWGYGLVGASSISSRVDEVKSVEQEHRVRRDGIEQLLIDGSATPVASAPSYTLPKPIVDPVSALSVAALIEDGVASAWRFVLGATDDLEVRSLALQALVDAAKQALRWRTVIDEDPSTTAFPGL